MRAALRDRETHNGLSFSVKMVPRGPILLRPQRGGPSLQECETRTADIPSLCAVRRAVQGKCVSLCSLVPAAHVQFSCLDAFYPLGGLSSLTLIIYMLFSS